MKILRLLLLPFSFVYGAILLLRHFLYDKGILKSTRFKKTTIVVGNLVVGGAGKTPMTEYLVRLLANNYKLATLSRGYGRKTKGYFLVETGSSVTESGDEPLQFKRKFPAITVADCEDRVAGLKLLSPHHDVFILDDAFQHRALNAGLSILLFDFNSLFESKFLLPAGNYRDLFSRRQHADIIVITKSPQILKEDKKREVIEKLNLKTRKPVFFSSIRYASPKAISAEKTAYNDIKENKIIAISGIANPKPFIEYLASKGELLDSIIFPDHHQFSSKDIQNIVKTWKAFGEEAILMTTEKDAMRFQQPDLLSLLSDLPMYYIPIEAVFQESDGEIFDGLVKSKVLNRLHDHD